MPSTTMKVKEAAAYIGMSEYTLRDLYKQKKIPCIRPNGKNGIVLFRKRSLDKWMDEQEASSVKAVEVSMNYNDKIVKII